MLILSSSREREQTRGLSLQDLSERSAWAALSNRCSEAGRCVHGQMVQPNAVPGERLGRAARRIGG